MRKSITVLALIASTALAERITFSPSQPASQVHHYRVYSSPHSTTNPAAVWTFRGAFTNPPTVLVTNVLTGSVTSRLLIQTNLPLGTISGRVSVVGTNGFEAASAKEEVLFPVSNLTIEVE